MRIQILILGFKGLRRQKEALPLGCLVRRSTIRLKLFAISDMVWIGLEPFCGGVKHS